MVDCEPLIENAHSAFASLRKARVHMQFSRNGSDEDVIIIDQLIDSGGEQQSQVKIALQAARKLFTLLTKIKVSRKLIVHCSFDKRVMIEGESLGAGLAALLVTELIRLHQFKREFFLRDDTAITGAINTDGNLLPVDAEGLKIKVEACIFSWVKILIVPKEQEVLCQEYLDDYRHNITTQNNADSIILPRVIGISNLEELFYNRRLTELEPVPVYKQGARKIWKFRKQVALIVIMAMTLLLVKLLYGPFDRNPVKSKVEGEMLLIKNQYGEKIDQIRISDSTVAPTAFYDVDGDGINEVIYGHKDDEQRGKASFLRCKSIVRDSILWEYKLNQDTAFPTEYNTTDRNFFCHELTVGDLGKGLEGRVIGTAVSVYSPCFVFLLNVKDGSEYGKYFHYGHLNGPAIVDLERNGIKEAVFGGVNDWIDDACIVVIDPRMISGVCTLGSGTGKALYEGCEKFYLRIPRTIVGEVYKKKHLARYSQAGIEEVRESDQVIRFRVTDVHPNSSEPKAMIYPHFGFDMRVIEVQWADEYSNIARNLFEQREISRFPDEEYFRKYQKTFEYWDGDKWTRKVTINGKYWEALKKLH
ncbi:MAG: hypothetical protein V1799_18305 [bacterium]